MGAVEQTLSARFRNVIKKNCEKTSWIVVIPVVEYDKPLLQSIDKINLQEANCATPKAFYGNHKSYNEYIRFAFLTGFT